MLCLCGGDSMGMESCNIEQGTHLKLSSIESVFTSIHAVIVDESRRPGSICWEMRGDDYIIEIQVLSARDGFRRISLRTALCCNPQAVQVMIELARSISRVNGDPIWGSINERDWRIDIWSADAEAKLTELFMCRRDVFLKGVGLDSIEPAAKRCGSDCIKYFCKHLPNGGVVEYKPGGRTLKSFLTSLYIRWFH